MSSYGSLSSKTFHSRGTVRSGDGSNDSPRLDPTETTPLLSVPDHSFFPGSGGVSVSTPPLGPRRDDDDLLTIDSDGVEREALPILSKIISNTPLGIEAEVVPATASTPDAHNDFRLPRDDTLRYIAPSQNDGENDDDEATEFSFHGGITTGQFWLIFTGILIANFIAAFDSTIMASTHTSITSSFQASEIASWLSTSFLLTSTSFQPLYGRVSDVVGRKIPFVFSCVVFTAATLWCALAQSIMSFIAARAVCGIGAGGMVTMGAIVLSDILPIEVRGSYQSINNLAWGSGSVLGAATGGFLADAVGWRWEFGLQVPFGIFCVAVLSCTIPSPENANSTHTLWDRFKDFDFAGSTFLTSSLIFLILGMNLGGNVLEWSDYRVIGSICIGLFLGNLLLRAEMRALSPVMPLRLLCSAPRGLLVFNNVFNMAIVNAVLFNLPLYFQTVRLESATVAGGRLLIPSLAGTFAGVSTGFIISRTGRLHDTLFLGAGLLMIGNFMFCFMPPNLPSWGYFIFLIPVNLGNGFAMPSTLLSILATSSQADQAVATSTLIMWRSLGGVFGVAVSSGIVQNFLNYFLERNVTGDDKREVIETVRKSVQAIFELDPVRQRQVSLSYESSLRFCFLFTTGMALVAVGLIYRIELPRIRRKGNDKSLEYAQGGE
ncbi:major facilitator superfamily domain-containing protein [Trichophaea hybrida]|nr:major facilitator superfamily domain-containing protein [Trichophaea hybrida]